MQKIAIVSRSFWPENPAIGEALLLLAESLARNHCARVITQVNKDFPEKLCLADRGAGVSFSTLPSLTNSSSHILIRIAELSIFTIFTFFTLCWFRPDKVYVATNPPLFTPFAVYLYCHLFGKNFVYHLQDIHPEATRVVTGKSTIATKLLKAIDVKTTLKASRIITLTDQMKDYIFKRAGQPLPIVLLNNPSVQGSDESLNEPLKREKGFVFCGNAGRLQRIPLLIDAIEKYLNQGGQLPFIFAGGGIYAGAIERLAQKFSQVTFLGVLPAEGAAKLLRSYSFGLLPIDDEVTNYAFPSKSSSYIFSGCHVVAICGSDTSVAMWVKQNELGVVAEPNVEAVTELFHQLDEGILTELVVNNELLEQLSPQSHANSLERIILHDV